MNNTNYSQDIKYNMEPMASAPPLYDIDQVNINIIEANTNTATATATATAIPVSYDQTKPSAYVKSSSYVELSGCAKPPSYTDIDQMTFLTNVRTAIPANPTYNRIKSVVDKYDISDNFVKPLKNLSRFDIVALFDDSGSMTTMIDSNNYHGKTRWDELKDSAQMVVDIATCFDADGIDAYFLNHNTYTQIHSFDQINSIFNRRPTGTTNISAKLDEIYSNKSAILSEKELLILVFTDGEPNNGDSFQNLRKTVQNLTKSGRIYITFIMCTDEDHIVESYDKYFDKKIPNVDVLDDYKSEARQIMKVQGNKYRFTYGDYIVKVMLGSIDNKIDILDEKPIDNCCVIL